MFRFDNGYSWISVLVNVPATIFATGYYEFLMRDSLQKIQKGHAEHEGGDEGLTRHLSKVTGEDVGGVDDRDDRAWVHECCGWDNYEWRGYSETVLRQ